MVHVLYYKCINFGLRPFVSVFLIFFFVVNTSGKAEKKADLSKNSVIDNLK